MKNRLYIITGGPGVGKTTLLNELRKRGYIYVEEVARQIIRQQINSGGEALPWKNKELYAEMMLKESVKSYKETYRLLSPDKIIFFDRGIPDTLCYARMIGLELTEEKICSALKCSYNSNVFILPPWKEIYRTDNERKQDWQEAEDTFHYMKNMYEEYGYRVFEVPKLSVENRANYVLAHLL